MSIRHNWGKIKEWARGHTSRSVQALAGVAGTLAWGIALAGTGVLVGLDAGRIEPTVVYGGSIIDAGIMAAKYAASSKATGGRGSNEGDGAGAEPQSPAAAVQGAFLASKSGTKYYPSWCKSASRIKESNRVWFDSEAEAAQAGYGKASTC
jgi:hypothetical protein